MSLPQVIEQSLFLFIQKPGAGVSFIPGGDSLVVHELCELDDDDGGEADKDGHGDQDEQHSQHPGGCMVVPDFFKNKRKNIDNVFEAKEMSCSGYYHPSPWKLEFSEKLASQCLKRKRHFSCKLKHNCQ